MTFLIDVAVRSSVILALGLLLMPLLRRQSAVLRHWILYACLMGAAAMPLAAWAVPDWHSVDIARIVPVPVTERLAPLSSALQITPRFVTRWRETEPPAATFGGTVDAAAIPAWLTGTLLSLMMLAVGILRLYRVEAQSTPVLDGPWHDRVPPGVSVRITRRPGLLLVWGVMRPSIIVPAVALTWSPARVTAVLRHETAHIRRHDWMLLVGSEVVRALYWFNPLVWVVCARLRAECEIACDDAVIADGLSGPDYATHVVDIARELNSAHWLPAPAIVRASTLERRIRAMLDQTRNRKPLSRHTRGVAFGIVFAATVAVAALAAQSFVSLSGTIVDPSNGVLPGAKLLLVNEGTQAKYEIQTDRSGRYEFVGLPPGTYTMEAVLPGFSRFSAQVTVGTQNLQQDLKMSIGMIQETVTVTSGPPRRPSVVTLSPEAARKLEERRARTAAQCGAVQPQAGPPIGGNIRVPVKVRDVRPIYPAALATTEGLVVLNASIGTSGTVDAVEVASSTDEAFTQAAIDAVRQWEFDATLLNCEPIVTPMQVTVNFKLK